MFPVIVLVYFLLARSEQKKMVLQSGDEYLSYRKQVRCSFPNPAAGGN